MKPASRGTILVIEEDDDTCTTILEVLAEEGYEAAGVRHGMGALSVLGRGAVPALVLLDDFVPDGRLVLDALEREPGLRGVPVVLTTTSSEGWPLALQAMEVLRKPFDLKALFALAARHAGPPRP